MSVLNNKTSLWVFGGEGRQIWGGKGAELVNRWLVVRGKALQPLVERNGEKTRVLFTRTNPWRFGSWGPAGENSFESFQMNVT